ncbi:hypothetical protein HDV05_003531 [Chytridiales sp. JEL 0842]|nr:hypothetical protein HDV05_003531 [Chytridiales sp. JEL 0842]
MGADDAVGVEVGVPAAWEAIIIPLLNDEGMLLLADALLLQKAVVGSKDDDGVDFASWVKGFKAIGVFAVGVAMSTTASAMMSVMIFKASLCKIASNLIMVILIINSFLEDISYKLGIATPPTPPVASILNGEGTCSISPTKGLPKPVFNRANGKRPVFSLKHRVLAHSHSRTDDEDTVTAVDDKELYYTSESDLSDDEGRASFFNRSSMRNNKPPHFQRHLGNSSSSTLHSRSSSDATDMITSSDDQVDSKPFQNTRRRLNSNNKHSSTGPTTSKSASRSRQPSHSASSSHHTDVNNHHRLESRKCTQDIHDYCEHAGYGCEEYATVTEDGYVLFLQRLQGRDGKQPTKGPVLLMHGLFQSSGVYVTNGDDSFAFYLVDQGYDVWLGNNRCVVEQHVRLKPNQKEFWNWSLDELAKYDVPCIIDFVRNKTGYAKIAFIGHSQGNAQLFMALRFNPELSDKLSLFVALAPAVFLGPLLKRFPVSLLMNCPSKLYRTLFGVKAILPIMSLVQFRLPAVVFMTLAYHMFHYLFNWTDTNWDRRNKNHYFQFTPRPQSTKNIHHWAQMGRVGVIKPFDPIGNNTQPIEDGKDDFDVSCIRCPLALYYGTQDTIIDGSKLYHACWVNGVNLYACEEIEYYEHMDCLWSMDARSRVWRRVVKVLRKAEKEVNN